MWRPRLGRMTRARGNWPKIVVLNKGEEGGGFGRKGDGQSVQRGCRVSPHMPPLLVPLCYSVSAISLVLPSSGGRYDTSLNVKEGSFEMMVFVRVQYRNCARFQTFRVRKEYRYKIA